MDFRILGPLEVSAGDGPLPLGGAKQRAVLAHLVLRANHVVPATVLIDQLWGEEPPDTARNTVQTYVHRLRGIVGQDRIDTRPAGYVLMLDERELDLSRFEALAAEARAELLEDPAAAVETLNRALSLWRGPPLGDLSEEPSLSGEIARLEELRLAAVEDRVSAELALGRHARIVGELESLTRSHPLRERLWGDLMLALYRSGRQGEALEAYQRARSVLSEELGIDPSRRLQRLHEQILAQDPALSAASRPIPVVAAPPSPTAPGELAAETKLAGYRIEDLLGRGGMSTVYLAEDTRLRRRVALKVLASELGRDERFRERFVRESQIAAGMEHPNIVPIYEAGEAEGHLFIAMRYVRGTDLRRLIAREGRLDPGRTVRILRDVASALDAAHAEGLVHRDVKPANILLIEGAGEDGRDVVYLSDFGLTKRLEGVSGGLTQTGQFVGTVDYVAPEQIEGKRVDGRADVYSLGCVLHECLTGNVPFGREAQVAALYAHLQDKPPKPSEERPDLPPGLDRVIARALAKSPNQRFATCGELIAAARAELAPGGAEAGSGAGRTRRSTGWIAAAATAAVVATVLAVSLVARDEGSVRASGATGQTAQQVLPSPSPTPSPNFPTAERPLSADEERLLTYIPKTVAEDCAPFDGHTPGAVGGLGCSAGGVEVLYQLFQDREAMDAALQINANIHGATGGECATDRVALTPYAIDDLPAGRVLCYRNRTGGLYSPGARSDIEWTDDRLLVYAHAVRKDAADLSLYTWWLDSAGPNVPTAGQGASSKDPPPSVARVPDGSYLLSLSSADAERTGLARIAGVKGVVSGTDWAGTWAFRVGDDGYELVHDGQPVESGAAALQKPGTVVFTPRLGQCVFGSTKPTGYAWSSRGATITWELGEEGGCAGPQPLTGLPWVRAPRGQLAFASHGDVFTADAAGLDRQPIDVADLPASAFNNQPVWSPDGSSLAFSVQTDGEYDLYVMNADGTGLRKVTDLPGNELDPAWSPDGSKLAFHHDPGGFRWEGSSLGVVGADGSGITTLLDDKGYVGRPAWSPDGATIAFQDIAISYSSETFDNAEGPTPVPVSATIWAVDPDGSNRRKLGDASKSSNGIAWTAAGDRIVFADDGPHGVTLYSMRSDGTDVRPLLDGQPPPWAYPVPALSPDGLWIVVTDDWSAGQNDPVDPHPAYLISVDGGQVFQIGEGIFEPSWRPGRA